MDFTKSIKKYFDLYENENTRHQNLWSATLELLRGKYIALSAYIRKKGNNMQDLSFYPKKQKNKQTKSANLNQSRRKEIIKIQAVINEIETEK